MLESVKDYFLIIISLITRIAVTKLNYTVKNDNIESQFLQRYVAKHLRQAGKNSRKYRNF